MVGLGLCRFIEMEKGNILTYKDIIGITDEGEFFYVSPYEKQFFSLMEYGEISNDYIKFGSSCISDKSWLYSIGIEK